MVEIFVAGAAALVTLWIGYWVGKSQQSKAVMQRPPEVYDKLTGEDGRVFYVAGITHNLGPGESVVTTIDLLLEGPGE